MKLPSIVREYTKRGNMPRFNWRDTELGANVVRATNANGDPTQIPMTDFAMDAELAAEREARELADSNLSTAIGQETTAREEADNDLATSIAQTDTALGNEAALRQSGDNALQTNINTEATTRASADTALQNSKFDKPTGTTGQYLNGLGAPTPFPTIPAAQVNSDWNAGSGVAKILNKPTTATASNEGFMPASMFSKLANFTVAGGSGSTSAILLAAGSVDLVINLSATMPNTNYFAVATISTGTVSILGTLSLSVKSKTTTTVTVMLKNTGLATIAAGVVIEVVAVSQL